MIPKFALWPSLAVGLVMAGLFPVAGQTNLPALPLAEARALAIKQHPRITAAELGALAAKQVQREARSAYFPTVTASATAAGTTGNNTRIAAGALNNPLILQREADGLNISQLITDFGRTVNLNASARLRAQAQEESTAATRAQISLAVDAAYYDALRAQAVVAVAKQTLAVRQVNLDQVTELARNQLRSGLDLSFATVRLKEGQLLLANAENDLAASLAVLANLLGDREPRPFRLVEEPTPPRQTNDPSLLVAEALRHRPDLARLRLEHDAANRFAKAEKQLRNPTLSAVGAAGILPIHDSQLKGDYAAAGINLSVPLFDGMLFSARAREAELRAGSAAENTREAENNVIRDVRIAILNLDYAADRLALTGQLLASAKESFELAQARYQARSSSIVELTQAQLAETEAEIEQARAKYEYLTRNAILNFQIGREP